MFDYNKEEAAYISVDKFVQNKSRKHNLRKEFKEVVEKGKALYLQDNPEQPEADVEPKQ